jgi:hypothetical protein
MQFVSLRSLDAALFAVGTVTACTQATAGPSTTVKDWTPSYSLTTRASRGDMSCPGRSRETGTFLESEKRLPRSLMRLCFRKKV